MIKVFFDGLCEPYNPGGVATFGVVVYQNNQIIHRENGLACKPFSTQASNNVAEYTAVIKAFEWLIKNNLQNEEIEVYGDSKLVIEQLSGRWKIKAHRIIPLFNKSSKLIKNFKNMRLSWIPIEKNSEADKLSSEVYKITSEKYKIKLPVLRERYQ